MVSLSGKRPEYSESGVETAEGQRCFGEGKNASPHGQVTPELRTGTILWLPFIF